MKALWRKGGASFWAAGCGVIRAQGLAPHGLRLLEAARAPQGGVPSASGWVGPLDALQSRHHPRPGVATVSPRYCYGIATALLRCISHVDAINMGDTPVRYRRDTVYTPCLLAWGYAGGGPRILNSAKGTRHRPPSQVIGLASSFSPRSAWRSRRGPASNACLSGAGLEKVVLTSPSLKSRRGSVQRKR